MKMPDDYKTRLYDKLFTAIQEDVSIIIEINHSKSSYKVSEGKEYLQDFMPETGTVRELFCSLIYKDGTSDKKRAGEYNQFIDETVFQKDKYQGDIRLLINGEEKGFQFLILNVSSDESLVIFFSQTKRALSNMNELEKIDTLQESYLFSMIVDLSTDSCVNPNTTEINAARQDFMDIKYSDWRLMISNMFKEEDKVLFLRSSAPEYVINKLEMKNSFHIDLQMMNMQGEFVWSRLNFVRMKNFSREYPRFVYTVSDISEDMLQLLHQEGLVKAIEEQNDRLQEADKNRTKFFSNMSHEIRTPINAIMGMNELILRDCQDSKIKKYAREVQGASQYLLSLVNDILDYSKIEAGKMEIVPVEYDTLQLLKKVYMIVQPGITEKGLEFEVKLGKDVPSRMFGDEIRITQILINLLTNAMKYTPKGKVTFLVERGQDENGQGAIVFTVKDTGIGIKQEDMETMFADYGRLDLIRNRNLEGTGLGMGIVEGLLSRMDSSLQVESVYGQGSAFSFTLLQKVVDNTPIDLSELYKEYVKPDVDIANVGDKKVLVVDDAAVNLRMFEAMMEPYKMEVYCARSGKKALQMMEKNEFDIVFLDHMMAEMDGVETLKKLRQLDEHYKTVPVISLTGNYSSTAREEYISIGFTDYLEKPVNPQVLDDLINKYVG